MAIGDPPNDIYHNGNFYNRNGDQISGVADLFSRTTAAVLTNGMTIFTLPGDIHMHDLVSECETANGAALTTLQYQSVPTIGTATTISGATASLASVAAGTVVTLVGDSFATAPTVSLTGPALSQTARGVFVPAGTLKLVIGTGPTTGVWKHYLRYSPLEGLAVVAS